MIRVESVLVWLAVVVLGASDCSAIMDGGLGLSADQLIDQSRGEYFPPTGIPENPRQSREIWSQERGIDFSNIGNASQNDSIRQEFGIDSEMESTLSDQDDSLSGIGQGEGASSTGTVASLRPAASQTMTAAALSLEGNWTFRLQDSKNRIMALRLYAFEEALFGTGTINDGTDTLRLSAYGSADAENMSLYAVTSGIVNLYRLNLTEEGASLGGEYRAFSSEGETWEGRVQGKRSA